MTDAFSRHYRVSELAKLWGFCDNTIIKLFRDEPGVLKLERITGKRQYTTLSIPESVALRVHQRLGQDALETSLPASGPPRIIRFRDLDGGMTQRPRNVVKLDAA